MSHSHNCCCNNSHSESSHSHGCCGGGGCHKVTLDLSSLTKDEQEFLNNLQTHQYLPMAEFVLKSTIEPDFEIIALTPVFLKDLSNSLEEVKATGNMLKNLEKTGFITLDYDIPLENYSYDEYYNSEVYSYFVQTTAEGSTKNAFLGDKTEITHGSIALTDNYINLIDDSDTVNSI